MEKTSTREEVASRLKAKEFEINQHIEALQEEVARTGANIKDFVQARPFLPVAGSILTGILVGLILGRRSKRARYREMLDDYMDRLAEVARQSGASERDVSLLLRDALRESIPSVVVSPSAKKTNGFGSRLFSMAADMAIGFAMKTIVNVVEDRFGPPPPSASPENADSGR
jgi:hypothetical protein